MLDLNKLNENLKFPKYDNVKIKYEKLFEPATKIKNTRNLIIHQTNVNEPRKDWENVWHTIQFELLESLLPELSRAIRKESQNQSFSLEKSSAEKQIQ